MPRLTVAALQLAAHDRGALGDVWPHIQEEIRACASGGAQLIVLPEGTLPAYVLGYKELTDGEIDAALRSCAQIAAECKTTIVIGAAHREDGEVYNGAVVFDRESGMRGIAHKQFLWHFDRQWFAPGRALQPIETSVGTLGVLICADGRIPTIARTLVERGAQMLVMPTAWVTSGRDPAAFENVQADLLARVRARENGVPFIAANKCGVEMRCVAYCGKSQIISAVGEIVAIASQENPQTLSAEIEIAPAHRPRRLPEMPSNWSGLSDRARVAICADAAVATPERLRVLEADFFIAPGTTRQLPVVGDDAVLDPAALATVRLEGCGLAVWITQLDPEWQERFARARALELRMYVIVIDAARKRAYAVDPDGAILCGTFGDYQIASFTYDPGRTEQTLVAPGTDVLEGLRSVEALE